MRIRKMAAGFLSAALLVLLSAGTAFAADQDIIILHTNDVHCGIEDGIGYSGVALYKKQMEAQTPYVFLLDAGDAIQGAPIGTLSDGGYIVDIMNEIGYDFAIPGNHEFDYGMERFLELSDLLSCGYYSCNFMDLKTGETKLPGYKMERFDDVDVAFVGVTTPESFTKSTPAYFQDASGQYIYGFCEDETGEALYAKVQAAADEARAAGAEYVILVGHLGKDGITEKWSAGAVIKNTTGIDAVIDGHSHQEYEEFMENKNGDMIPVAQTGTKLNALGKLTITLDGAIKTELVKEIPAFGEKTVTVKSGDSLSRIAKRELGSYSAWMNIYEANRDTIKDPNLIYAGMVLKVPGSSEAEEGKQTDPETDRFIAAIESQYEESLKTVLGHTDVDLAESDPETGARAVRSKETNLGDFCADAYRYVLGTDIGLMNGGGIRTGILAGDITYEDMLNVYPFGNMICAARVTGQQIWDALEMGARFLPEESGSFLHVSGLTFTIDTSVPSGVQLDDKQNFTGVEGEYRVRDILVNGEPLDPQKTYTVASHNYMLKNGGSGMAMFSGCEIIKDDVMVDVDTLSAYVRDFLGGSVKDGYENPMGAGRITIK